jgi:Rrf2 family protein
MPLLSRKSLVAIATVLDIALHARGVPVTSRSLAERVGVPPRYLEPILQALGRSGIVKGQRGPRGGYELARERRRISAADILAVAGSVPENGDVVGPVVTQVVEPAMKEAETAFLTRLGDLTIEDLVARAETVGLRGRAEADFTI